jgi:DNA-binding transcriptional regulator YiaG
MNIENTKWGVGMVAAEVIKKWRVKKDLDQTMFASMMGVGQSAVSRWENGGAIDKDNCIKLAKLTGLAVMVFLKAGAKGG